MINQDQFEYIKRMIWTSDQDYFYWSCARGEPFLHENTIHFFDGETLSLVGFPLDQRQNSAVPLQEIRTIIERWLSRERVDFINYYGPQMPTHEDVVPPTYSLVYTFDPSPYNVDTWIDFSDPTVMRTRNARESLRKVRAKHIDARIKVCTMLGWEHIQMFQALCTRATEDLSDVSMILSSLAILRNEEATFVEARRGSTLVGFGLAHEFFPGKPILLLACSDRAYASGSDAVYAELIEHFQRKGASCFNLGYTIDEGIYRYKTKWGGVRTGKPVMQLIWKERSSGRDFAGCLHWPCRALLSKKCLDS